MVSISPHQLMNEWWNTGVTGMGTLSLLGADVPGLMTALGNVSVIGPVAKVLFAFPLIYHYGASLRHAVSEMTFPSPLRPGGPPLLPLLIHDDLTP